MKIELTIDSIKKIPDGAILALESELLKRLSKQLKNCQLTIKRASQDGLTVFGSNKKENEYIVQETWGGADEWFN